MPSSKSAKIVQITERTTVTEAGEVIREDRERILRLPQEPEFIKLYLQDLGAILDVPAGPQTVLLALMRKLDWEGMITLSPAARSRIADSLKIKAHTLANYITTLCDKHIIRRVGRGEYEVNPHLMAKGDWNEVMKRRAGFRLTVVYSRDGTKTVTGTVDQGEPLPPSAA
jgi:hypothetical protein